MVNFEDREETKIVCKALMILLELNLCKSIKSVKAKDNIGELMDLMTRLYDIQKKDYEDAVKIVLSSMEKENMGKC